jgi:exonuclease III
MDLIEYYRVLHPARAQYTFFSEAHGTFLQIDHILGHKASINKYKQIDIPPCIMYDHNTTKREFNKRNSTYC